MKLRFFSAKWTCWLLLLSGVCVFTGCGKADKSPSKQETIVVGSVDVAPLEKAFESSMSFRPMVDEMVKIIRAAHYADALSALQRLATNPQITIQQKQTVEALIQSIREQAVAKTIP